MHKIRFPLGLCPQTSLRQLTALPQTAVFKGPTSKGKEGEEGKRKRGGGVEAPVLVVRRRLVNEALDSVGGSVQSMISEKARAAVSRRHTRCRSNQVGVYSRRDKCEL